MGGKVVLCVPLCPAPSRCPQDESHPASAPLPALLLPPGMLAFLNSQHQVFLSAWCSRQWGRSPCPEEVPDLCLGETSMRQIICLPYARDCIRGRIATVQWGHQRNHLQDLCLFVGEEGKRGEARRREASLLSKCRPVSLSGPGAPSSEN